MRSERFSSYFGGLGVETCSLDAASAIASVGNRRQPSATVGNRRQPSATVATVDNEVAMAVPMASSAKVVTLGDFKRRVA